MALLFFSFAFILLTSTVSYSCQHKHRHRMIENSGDTDKLNHSSDQHCFCNANPEHIAPEIISDGDNIERLVVYYYIHKITKQIHMFTPNKSLQICFPDLTTAHDEGDLVVVKSEDLKLFLDSNPELVAMEEGTASQLKPSNKRIKGTTNPQPLINNHGIPLSKPKGRPISHTHKKRRNPYIYMKDEDAIHFPENEPIKETTKEKSEKINKWESNAENPAHYISNEDVEAYQSIFVPLHASRGQQMTFDEWFIQQMLGFVDDDRDLHQSVIVRELKLNVMKTLNENSMYIKRDGVIIDDRGKVIKPTNLRLRPILIGDSMTYKEILHLKDDTTPFTASFPFLDTIAITKVFPSQLLGIIPLGKVLIPKMSSRIINNWQQNPKPTPSNIPEIATASPFNVGTESSPAIHDTIKEKEHKIIKPKTKSDPKEMRKTVSKTPIPLDLLGLINAYASLYGLHRNKTHSGILDAMNSHSEDAPPKYRPSEDIPPEDSLSEDMIPQSSNDEYEEDLEMDYNLGLRIIGGNAATSSGTPLNSKGRSSG